MRVTLLSHPRFFQIISLLILSLIVYGNSQEVISSIHMDNKVRDQPEVIGAVFGLTRFHILCFGNN